MDFVARQETLAEDMAALLGKLNARRDEGGRVGTAGKLRGPRSLAEFAARCPSCHRPPSLLGSIYRSSPAQPSFCPCSPSAGVPPLVPGKELGTEKMRSKCASGSSVRAVRHGSAPMHDPVSTWQGLVAKEQYCSTEEYYSGRHTHCRASVEAYFADDLRLLYPGMAAAGGG